MRIEIAGIELRISYTRTRHAGMWGAKDSGLPTVEPAARNSSAVPPVAATDMGQPQEGRVDTEILGNTNDPLWRFSLQTVPTRCALTVPGGLPFGFVVQPFAEAEDSSRWLRREAERCQGCGAFRNLYVSVEANTGRWLCNFCGRITAADDLKGKESIEACRELRDAVVQYVEPVPSMCGAELGNSTYIFVIDTTIRQRDVADMQAAMVSAVQAMSPSDHIGLVAFDGVVKVFDLSVEGCASAHVLPGHASPSQRDLNVLGASGAVVTAPVHACAAALVAIVKSLRPPARKPSRAKGQLRCLGPAIETSIAIAAASRKTDSTPSAAAGLAPSSANHRVMVLLGGPATAGPGVAPEGDEEQDGDPAVEAGERDEATRYYAAVGERSYLLGVAVDIFAVSALGVGVARLQALTSASGGSTVVHSTFGEALQGSMRQACTGAGTGGRSGGVVDVHCSAQIDLMRMIGPLLPPVTKEQVALAESLPNLAISPAVQAAQAYTGVFQLRDDVADEFVYFQLATAHTTSTGQRVLRVSTQRLPVTDNTAVLMQSVDVDVAAVVMGKEAVVAVGEGAVTASEARHELSQRLQTIATTLGGQVKLTMQGRMSTLPAHLAHLPQLVYHLQSGPLLGPILNDHDNTQALRLLFLNANVDDARRMLCPALLSCSLDGAFNFSQVPLQDLSLVPDRLLVLDHHTHVLVWSGSQVAGAAYDETRRQLAAIVAQWTAYRFPAPEIMFFNEGDSMARWLMARLDPASKDQPSAGLTAGLAGAVRGLLRQRFLVTDDLSMNQWLSRYRMAL